MIPSIRITLNYTQYHKLNIFDKLNTVHSQLEWLFYIFSQFLGKSLHFINSTSEYNHTDRQRAQEKDTGNPAKTPVT